MPCHLRGPSAIKTKNAHLPSVLISKGNFVIVAVENLYSRRQIINVGMDSQGYERSHFREDVSDARDHRLDLTPEEVQASAEKPIAELGPATGDMLTM